jgi:ribosome maturation factor RimP
MALKEKVENIITSLLSEEFYLVDVSVSVSKIRTKISVFVDSDQGIGVDQCGQLSHAIGEALDESIEDKYTLEVSSPGADSPLKFKRQYLKNIGRVLKINTLDKEEIKGTLLEVLGEDLIIQPEAKKKQVIENKTVSLTQIKDAKVVLSFK